MTDDQSKTIPKPELKWFIKEDKLMNSNSKALNAICNVVDPNQFKMISMCDSTKDGWEILQTANEGTDTVRLSRL